MDNQQTIEIKLVVVGDNSVGKTGIIRSYTGNGEIDLHDYKTQIMVDSQMITLSFCDTTGQETYNRLRRLYYAVADTFMIVFSVADKQSFENALNMWYPEVNKDELANIPKVFIGNKINERNDYDQNHIKTEDATQLISQLGCKYYECSALTQQGLTEAFDQAIRLAKKSKGKTSVPGKPIAANEKKQEEKPNCSVF